MSKEKPLHNEIIFSDKQEEQIIDMYVNQKLSSPKIASTFGVKYHSIIKVLKERGIPRKHNGMRKHELNEHYFDEIDTQNKAYILGFLYADGNNCPQKSTIRMQLQDIDKEILEKIRMEIGSSKPLSFINQSVRKYKDYNYHYCDMWSLDMYSAYMCRVLNDKGVVPNKSLILQFPIWLKEELYPHFIRGYFDGDGSIVNYKTEKYGFRSHVTITSTEKFCLFVQHILNAKIGIKGGIYDASSHNGITKVLSISGNNSVKLFMNWLYEDAHLYMKRKYNRYVELLDYINKSQAA